MHRLLSVIAVVLIAVAAQADAPGGFPLERFVGDWVGRSSDGRFEERVSYRWGPGKRYLDVDMTFVVDGTVSGTGRGFMLVDDASGELVFQMLSSLGTAIRQRQIGRNGDTLELAAAAVNGARAGMPAEFRTRFHHPGDDRYETELLIDDGSGWQVAMHNRFERR